jgi:hypothetical protein
MILCAIVISQGRETPEPINERKPQTKPGPKIRVNEGNGDKSSESLSHRILETVEPFESVELGVSRVARVSRIIESFESSSHSNQWKSCEAECAWVILRGETVATFTEMTPS